MAELTFSLILAGWLPAAPVPPGPRPDPLGWGYLGITEAYQSGLVVGDVRPGTPADLAGIKPGDRLVRVGNLVPGSFADISEYVCRLRPGSVIRIQVRREDEVITITVRLGVRPPPPELPPPQFRQPAPLHDR